MTEQSEAEYQRQQQIIDQAATIDYLNETFWATTILEGIWHTKDKGDIKIKAMTDDHILNTINFLKHGDSRLPMVIKVLYLQEFRMELMRRVLRSHINREPDVIK